MMRKIYFGLLGLLLLTVGTGLRAESLDINSATVEQLSTLSGIGKAKAEAIVKDREKNGPFKSVDDLARVKGIKAATINKNREKISAGAAAAPVSAPAAPAIAPAKAPAAGVAAPAPAKAPPR